MATWRPPSGSGRALYEGFADPEPDADRDRGGARGGRESSDILQVNFGPNHPSTHGVLRLIVDLRR